TLTWRAVTVKTNEDPVLDFNELLGRQTDQGVAYAVCCMRSENTQRELQMLVGSDDQCAVYLNGKESHRSTLARSFVADEDVVPHIAMNADLNVLVFKVVNQTLGWQGSIRFQNAQGKPVQKITVTLTP